MSKLGESLNLKIMLTDRLLYGQCLSGSQLCIRRKRYAINIIILLLIVTAVIGIFFRSINRVGAETISVFVQIVQSSQLSH